MNEQGRYGASAARDGILRNGILRDDSWRSAPGGSRGSVHRGLLAALGGAVILSLAFVVTVVLRVGDEESPDTTTLPAGGGEEAPRDPEMPDRTRAIETLRTDREDRPVLEEPEPEPGPVAGWTLENSRASVAEALEVLRSSGDDTDPERLRIAVQQLIEQGDFALPFIQEALATAVNPSYGGRLSVVQDRMELYPDMRIALMEALRRIDSEASLGVLSGLLANATDPREAGYAVWMIQNSSAAPEVLQGALAPAADALMGSGFAGVASFEDLASTRWLLRALEAHPVPGSVPGLARIAREADSDLLRREAEQALAASGEPDAVATILDIYRGVDEPRLRQEKARLLGQTHGPAVLVSLRDHLFDAGRDGSERSAMVAGMAAYNSVFDREEQVEELQGTGRDEELTDEVASYRADLTTRVEILDELLRIEIHDDSLRNHAEIARRRLNALLDRLSALTAKKPD